MGRGWEQALCSSEALAEPPGWPSRERAVSVPAIPPQPASNPGTRACPGICPWFQAPAGLAVAEPTVPPGALPPLCSSSVLELAKRLLCVSEVREGVALLDPRRCPDRSIGRQGHMDPLLQR